MRALSQSTPRRICCSGGRLKLSGAGSRTPGSMRLRRESHHRRRARDNSAQRSARLGGLLSRMRGPTVCDPPRIASELLAPRRKAVGRLRPEPPPAGRRPRVWCRTLRRAFGCRSTTTPPGAHSGFNARLFADRLTQPARKPVSQSGAIRTPGSCLGAVRHA